MLQRAIDRFRGDAGRRVRHPTALLEPAAIVVPGCVVLLVASEILWLTIELNPLVKGFVTTHFDNHPHRVRHEQPAGFLARRFHNVQPEPPPSVRWFAQMIWRLLSEPHPDTRPAENAIPVRALDAEAIRAAPVSSLWRITHSCVLLKLSDGQLWLTDPCLGLRASPLSWVGPLRFGPPAISARDLPPLAGILVSHNHYDHLCRESLLTLAPKTTRIVVPLELDKTLVSWGIPSEKIHAMNWWQSLACQSATTAPVHIHCAPAQHFSGRVRSGRNRTLWASFVVDDGASRIFFSGDGGYAPHFQAIGKRFADIDIALLENGAYDRAWEYFHMPPRHTAQAHADLGARCLLPVHNSTFRQAWHPWYEPLEQMTQLAQERGFVLCAPEFGERISIHHPETGQTWWRKSMPDVRPTAPRMPAAAAPTAPGSGRRLRVDADRPPLARACVGADSTQVEIEHPPERAP